MVKDITTDFFNKNVYNLTNLLKDENELSSIVDEYTYQNNLIIFMGAGSVTHWAKNFITNHR